MADPDKLAEIEKDKELAANLLGDDTAKIQATLKKIYAMEKRYNDSEMTSKMNSSDLLRAGCTTPRDPVRVVREHAQGRAPVRSPSGSSAKSGSRTKSPRPSKRAGRPREFARATPRG